VGILNQLISLIMRKLFFITLCIIIQSCNSQTAKKEKEEKKPLISKPFDLANLILNEDINNILSCTSLSLKDTIKNNEITLIGNEKLVFTSEKLLVFNKTKIAGKNNIGVNNVIFHYGKIDSEIGAINNEKNNIIGLYQIKLYSENEIQKLLQNLKSKLGKEFFEKEIAGNLSDIKDNSLIETSNKFKQTVIIWKNSNLIYYCCIDNLNGKTDSLHMFVFNKKSTEWIGFISGLGYQNTEKCL
jgi:hypothetical protein